MALLDVNNAVLHYGKFEAIKGISLNVQPGEVVSLIGANGAGKTSILRAIIGLHPLTSGEVWFQDRRVDGMLPYRSIQLGISLVPEGRRLFPYMSVSENIVMGAISRKDKSNMMNDVEEMYRRFPILKERRRQQAQSLSGGEQQMVAIARSLMSKPQLMLLDEPSLGLAPLMVQEVGHIIGGLSESGVSILLVEQNVSMALELANRAYVLEMGRIHMEGKLQELLKNDHVRKAYLSVE